MSILSSCLSGSRWGGCSFRRSATYGYENQALRALPSVCNNDNAQRHPSWDVPTM
ncbi:MAG: hypothetical protein LBQ84_07275 [Flavobacteriaceae bacterium]|nr:hypothetical protein [Flavobacteriaceae bacterium]